MKGRGQYMGLEGWLETSSEGEGASMKCCAKSGDFALVEMA
jgi:hypothetical protein